MKPNGAGVCVVGDDAQAIYSFRAATVDNILDFPTRFTPPRADRQAGAQLSLGAADPRCGERADERQRAAVSEGAALGATRRVASRSTSPCRTTRRRRSYVVEQVLAAREQGTLLRTQAVLVRSSHHSDVLELELLRRNIPYVKYGGLKFLEAAHVKDVLALLRWADNPRNRIAGFRVLQLLPGVGPATADRCLKVFEASGYAWPTSCAVPDAGGGGSPSGRR